MSSAKSPLSKLSLEKRNSKIRQKMAKLCRDKDTLSFAVEFFKVKDRVLKLDNFALSYPIIDNLGLNLRVTLKVGDS